MHTTLPIPARSAWQRTLGRLTVACLAATLVACGGGGGDDESGHQDPAAPVAPKPPAQSPKPPAKSPAPSPQATTRADAFRLMTQGTFGPTEADVTRVMDIGPAAWVDQQLKKPARKVHAARWKTDNERLAELVPNGGASSRDVVSSFYREAITADDQLRQRVAFALSEIFVISTLTTGPQMSLGAADYLDMLTENAFGNYRTLLEKVTLHPTMGKYLSTMHNSKEDPITGQLPDQNYAREVMQLFSIGPVMLHIDGTPRMSGGKAIESYDQEDIEGLSRAFTGFSWGGGETTPQRYWGTANFVGARNVQLPMQGYKQYHSTAEKRFLNRVIGPQSQANPAASLKAALDTIAAHPNVGPFISRQLIQRLVTSHPSPAYVARVARVFNDDGDGERGNLKAVVRAILLDNDARNPAVADDLTYGKLREPVLRLTAYLRAFGARSDSGRYLIRLTDDPGLELGQTPLRSSSVFNFFRPGFIPTSGEAAERGMTVPELQITTESSVAGYANYMLGVVTRGVGLRGEDNQGVRPDVQVALDDEIDLADNPSALIDRITQRLIGTTASADMKRDMRTAIESIAIPALNRNGTNGSAIAQAKRARVLATLSLTLLSPEFIVQK